VLENNEIPHYDHVVSCFLEDGIDGMAYELCSWIGFC